MHVVMEGVDRRFGPELLVANHRVHDGIKATARRPMCAWIAKRPIDQLLITEAIADHPEAPMLAEDEVGRGRQNLFLRDNRLRRRAKPSLNFRAFVGREKVKAQVVSPRRGAPMIPSPPL